MYFFTFPSSENLSQLTVVSFLTLTCGLLRMYKLGSVLFIFSFITPQQSLEPDPPRHFLCPFSVPFFFVSLSFKYNLQVSTLKFTNRRGSSAVHLSYCYVTTQASWEEILELYDRFVSDLLPLGEFCYRVIYVPWNSFYSMKILVNMILS